MRLRKHLALWWLTLAVVVLAAVGCGGDEAESGAAEGDGEVPTIVIGELAELTGAGAEAYGPPVHNGIETGIEEVRSSGYLDGVANLELRTVDNGSDPTTAVTELNRFIQDGVEFVLESAITPINLAIAPIAEREGVLHIGVASGGTDNIPAEFPHMTDPLTPMQTAGEYAINEMGVERIGLVVDGDNEALQTFGDGFVQGVEAAGAPDAIVTKQTVGGTDTDFSSVLTNLERANVDAVLPVVTIPASGNFLEQMAARSSFDDVAKIGHTVWDPTVAEIAGDAAEGSIFPQQWLPTDSPDFVDDYRAQYDEAPSVYSVYGHDAIWLIAVAMKLTADAGEELSGENVKTRLVEASTAPDFVEHREQPEFELQPSLHPRVPGRIATFDESGSIVSATEE